MFATKIVASNFLGFDSKFSTTLDWLGYWTASSFKFFDDNEKRATSAAATIAQQKSNTEMPMIPNKISVLKAAKNDKLGSESKIKKIY